MSGPGQSIADTLDLLVCEFYEQFRKAIQQRLDSLRIIEHLDKKAGHFHDVAGDVQRRLCIC